ncbi:MAG: hypothetical protein QF464_16225, partial [Myxococcota bacterium]|nr:hypothetical protein [Myxococcota bacterium]
MSNNQHALRLLASFALIACGGGGDATGDQGTGSADAAETSAADTSDDTSTSSPGGDAQSPGGDAQSDPSDDATVTGDAAVQAPDTQGHPRPSGWIQPVADGDWEWLVNHDGVGVGAHLYNGPADPEVPCTTDEDCTGEGQFCHSGLGNCRVAIVPDGIYEYARFEIFQPFRLRTVRVQVEVTEDTTLTVHVW